MLMGSVQSDLKDFRGTVLKELRHGLRILKSLASIVQIRRL